MLARTKLCTAVVLMLLTAGSVLAGWSARPWTGTNYPAIWQSVPVGQIDTGMLERAQICGASWSLSTGLYARVSEFWASSVAGTIEGMVTFGDVGEGWVDTDSLGGDLTLLSGDGVTAKDYELLTVSNLCAKVDGVRLYRPTYYDRIAWRVATTNGGNTVTDVIDFGSSGETNVVYSHWGRPLSWFWGPASSGVGGLYDWLLHAHGDWSDTNAVAGAILARWPTTNSAPSELYTETPITGTISLTGRVLVADSYGFYSSWTNSTETVTLSGTNITACTQLWIRVTGGAGLSTSATNAAPFELRWAPCEMYDIGGFSATMSGAESKQLYETFADCLDEMVCTINIGVSNKNSFTNIYYESDNDIDPPTYTNIYDAYETIAGPYGAGATYYQVSVLAGYPSTLGVFYYVGFDGRRAYDGSWWHNTTAGGTTEHYIDWEYASYTNGIPNVATGGYKYVESFTTNTAAALQSAYPPSITNNPIYDVYPTINDVPASLSTYGNTEIHQQKPNEHLWFTVYTNSLIYY